METKSIPKKRMPYFDNIKGILVILMVFGHFLYRFGDSPMLSYIVNAVYTFHMPAFVFVSGYLGKSERSQSFEGIIKLAFLFFIFNGAMGIVFGIEPLTEPKYSLWYLLAIIAWRLTARYISRFKFILPILICISLAAGLFPSINNTLAIARIISFYPYYMAGFLFSKEKCADLIKNGFGKRMLEGIAALAVSAVLIVIALNVLKLDQDDLTMYAYKDYWGIPGRITLLAISCAMIFALMNLVPNKKLPLVTMFGRNSLWIFLIHRPITIVISKFLVPLSPVLKLLISVILTAAVCVFLGNDLISKPLNAFANTGADLFTSESEDKTVSKLIAVLSCALIFFGYIAVDSAQNYKEYLKNKQDPDKIVISGSDPAEPLMFSPVISDEQSAEFSSAMRITFAGDLILLEDQVKRGCKENGYDFSELFKYTKDRISSADFAIGVFEGPMAGAEAGYSSSNYGDGKELYLNFPDEFAAAVKDAGFDLVTTANNHLLDKGLDGALRTLDVLDNIGLDHTGSYRSIEEKENSRVKLVTVDGIKLAVLSYTYGTNYYKTADISSGGLSYITSFACGTGGRLFESLKAQVEKDFADAKALDPDLIIVLPHMGTQFSNTADKEQLAWFEIFKKNGADIILGDHTHSVEPVSIDNYNGKNVFTLYCPGNYANIYRENQGDTSALADVYIDRSTKKVIGGGVVPLYTQSTVDGNFIPIPINKIENDPELRAQISTDDYGRAKTAHAVVTRVMLGVEEDISAACGSYLFNENGYIRRKVTGLKLTNDMKSGTLYSAIEKASGICFIGDSLTEGTMNGGRPWYEPIEEHFPGKSFSNFSKGGATIKDMIDGASSIPAAGLYVIAIGTNDIHCLNDQTCALTAADYIERAEELRRLLIGKDPSAGIIFIAPWHSTDGGEISRLGFADVVSVNNEYSAALKNYCAENSLGFIDPNPFIRKKLEQAPQSLYLLDRIHPNASRGLIMYSEAVLASG